MTGGIRRAFVLGAGLGTRLRPLTEDRPKPLVPIFHKPLITFAFDHLRAFGVEDFVVNTHHCPEAYDRLLGSCDGRADYAGCPVMLRHEPILLDTAGGLKNAQDLLGTEPILIHNGDVLADLPLDRLIDEHFSKGNAVTLALRSQGGVTNVQFNAASGRVTDMRGVVGGQPEPAFLFTGIYLISPKVFEYIPAGEICSVVPIFLTMMQAGERVGGIVMDEGLWFDLGNRESYCDAHRMFFEGIRLSYPLENFVPEAIHPLALVADSARLEGMCIVGPEAVVEHDSVIKDSILWERSHVHSGADLQNCIVRDGRSAEGRLSFSDI